MYRQLLIVGLVAGASLTVGGIAAVWTMEKSPAELHSDLGHKLKPVARSMQAASWNEQGRAALAPVAVAPAGAARHAVPLVAQPHAIPVLLAAAASAADEPALPAASKGAGHCALADNCTPGLAGGSQEPRAGRPGAPLAAPGMLPLASAGAPAVQPNAGPAVLTAPAPSVTMLLADSTPVVPTTIVEAIEYGRTGGPRAVLGQAQEVPGAVPPGAAAPAPSDPSGAAPGGPADSNAGTPVAGLAPSQPAGSPSASPDTLSSPVVELASGPQVVRQLDPTGQGPSAPLLEQAVSPAADSAVGEPSTNILLLIALLGAAVMVRRRVP